ncbi:MAG TPA: glycosyltransferase, partial [Candidatus Elarobacter sp.]|nr:glycosyltransferase [Candidatus Elarobacter sp.]
MNSSSPLSIVYVWDADYPWDVRTQKVCLALAAAGHRVTIVARNRAWLPESEALPEGTVRRMPAWRWAGQRADGILGFPAFFSPRWSRLIRHAVRDAAADLIIVRDIPLCPTAIAVGRRLRVPVMLDMAENYPAMMRVLWETERHTSLDYLVRNPRATALVERLCVRAVDHIVVVVEESAERVRALGVPESKLTIVSNTPPRDRVEETPARRARAGNRIDVAYMGNIEVARGLLEAVDAIAHLNASGCPARLRIIGRGRDRDF